MSNNVLIYLLGMFQRFGNISDEMYVTLCPCAVQCAVAQNLGTV